MATYVRKDRHGSSLSMLPTVWPQSLLKLFGSLPQGGRRVDVIAKNLRDLLMGCHEQNSAAVLSDADEELARIEAQMLTLKEHLIEHLSENTADIRHLQDEVASSIRETRHALRTLESWGVTLSDRQTLLLSQACSLECGSGAAGEPTGGLERLIRERVLLMFGPGGCKSENIHVADKGTSPRLIHKQAGIPTDRSNGASKVTAAPASGTSCFPKFQLYPEDQEMDSTILQFKTQSSYSMNLPDRLNVCVVPETHQLEGRLPTPPFRQGTPDFREVTRRLQFQPLDMAPKSPPTTPETPDISRYIQQVQSLDVTARPLPTTPETPDITRYIQQVQDKSEGHDQDGSADFHIPDLEGGQRTPELPACMRH